MAEKTCIVCGKSFDEEKGLRWMQDGSWYLFDDLGCRASFIGAPAKYLEQKS